MFWKLVVISLSLIASAAFAESAGQGGDFVFRYGQQPTGKEDPSPAEPSIKQPKKPKQPEAPPEAPPTKTKPTHRSSWGADHRPSTNWREQKPRSVFIRREPERPKDFRALDHPSKTPWNQSFQPAQKTENPPKPRRPWQNRFNAPYQLRNQPAAPASSPSE